MKVNADDEEIIRARKIKLCPSEATIGHLDIIPGTRADNGPAADDAVRDIVSRFAIEVEVGAECEIDELPQVGGGGAAVVSEFLDGDHVGFEAFKDVDSSSFVTLTVAGGDIGGHDTNREIRLRRRMECNWENSQQQASDDP